MDYFDTALAGFLLEVRQSGGKTYYQRYRDARGRERQFKIGPASVLTVAQARRKARNILAQAFLGDDPQQQRQELRQMPSFKEFVTTRYLPFAKDTKRSWRTDETVLRIHILPKLGNLKLDEVTPAQVADLVKRTQDKGYAPGTINRVLILTRYVFNLAKKWGVLKGIDNPTGGIATLHDVHRERFLAPDEAQRLLAALDADENRGAAQAIRLLLLTGARRNEVTHAKWEYIDWERRSLLVPISKTGRPRIIPLSSAALELLRSIERLPGNPFIFPSGVTGRPCPSLHFPWTRIRRRAGLDGVRLHDLRHSFASFLVNNGVSLYVVQGLLGHTQPRTTQRYAHLAHATLLQAAEIVDAAIHPASEAS